MPTISDSNFKIKIHNSKPTFFTSTRADTWEIKHIDIEGYPVDCHLVFKSFYIKYEDKWYAGKSKDLKTLNLSETLKFVRKN